MAKRWPLFAGIAWAVLVLAALFVIPTPPEVSASGAHLVRYYQDHANGIRVAAWSAAVSTVPLVLLIAALRSHLTGIGRDVMLIGGTSFAIQTVIWSWTAAGLALHPFSLDPSVARTVTDIAAFYGPMLTMSIVLFIVPVGIAAWHGEGGLPRWLGILTAVFAIEQSIETITIFGKRGFIAPGGPMNFVLGAGLTVVWIVAAGAAASRATGASANVAA